VDLSSIYFDILKDRIYASAPESIERRSAQTVLYELLHSVVVLVAPVLTFSSEEVWQHMKNVRICRKVYNWRLGRLHTLTI